MSPIIEAMKPSPNSDRQSCASSGELFRKNGTAFATEPPTTFVSSRPTIFGSSRRPGIATEVLAHLHNTLLLDVEVSCIFEAPTVAEMAQHLEMLIDCGQARRLSSAIPRSTQEAWAPASIAQERLCALQHALPDIPFLNILYALRLTSSFDVSVLVT